MNFVQNLIGKINCIFRVVPIGNALLPFLKSEKTALDIGCWDGALGDYIAKKKNVFVEGVDVKLPAKIFIPAIEYAGKRLPFKANSFDCALLIDVLHHSKRPLQTLLEAKRVARKAVIIKDILCRSALDYFLNLSVDLLGNTGGINLPNRYFNEQEWRALIKNSGLKVVKIDKTFKLYRPDLLHHIIMRLEK